MNIIESLTDKQQCVFKSQNILFKTKFRKNL